MTELEHAYNELLSGGHLAATESVGKYTLPSGEGIERPLYAPKY